MSNQKSFIFSSVFQVIHGAISSNNFSFHVTSIVNSYEYKNNN